MEADGQAVKWNWTRQRKCVWLARSQLRKTLVGWGMVELEFAAVAVLSELVTNAVVHARVPPGRQIQTRFIPLGGGVRIEVHDASDKPPLPREPDDKGGYGLRLVAELSEQWGVEKRSGIGKCVWAVVTESSGRAGERAGLPYGQRE